MKSVIPNPQVLEEGQRVDAQCQKDVNKILLSNDRAQVTVSSGGDVYAKKGETAVGFISILFLDNKPGL